MAIDSSRSHENGALGQFVDRVRDISQLESVLELLAWDQETKMPLRTGPFRAKQVALLARLHHQHLIQPELGELVGKLQGIGLEDPWVLASLRETERHRSRALQIPETLVAELAEVCSLAHNAWVQARKESSFKDFAPWLRRVLNLKRQEATCLQLNGSHLYDPLLDEYEPGMTVARLDPLFESMKPTLTSLLKHVTESPTQPDPSILSGHYPPAEQESFGRRVLTEMGFDWKAGRLDSSAHPFCTGLTPLDVRITTRYSESDFTGAFFGIIHEGGHALYEQGLPSEHYGLPSCGSVSLGIHESQSRLWENQVARSLPFWRHWYPELQAVFSSSLANVKLEDFLPAVNHVQASFIRVEADEVSYCLHIILRYELEKAMLQGDLETEDLEEAWNQKMSQYLGIQPPDAAQGALQDTHWSQGLIGYFPTYLLGNLYSAQFFQTARQAMPDLDQQLEEGNMKGLREWLRRNIHARGLTLTAEQLIKKVSGEPLREDYFLSYLESKFADIYDLR